MDSYLPTVINSLRTGSRFSVDSVLKNIKADKAEIASLILGIKDFQINNYFDPGLVSNFSALNKEYLIDAFRDSDIRIKNYFSAANTVGLIINSMLDIFTSEIEKLEKDVDVLENFVNNYEYLAGKDDLYNSNYIEKFDNSLFDYRSDGIIFPLVDRDNVSFDENGNGFVDTKSGTFKIGNESKITNLTKSIESIIIKSNYDFMDYSDTGFNSVFTETLFDSWSVSVKSPSIIKSPLNELSEYCGYDTTAINGAQTYVEIMLSSPQLMDTLYITPNYSNGLQLLQVVLFNDEQPNISIFNQNFNQESAEKVSVTSSSRGFIPVLSKPKLIDSVSEIIFEKTLVKKIVLIFNQSLYKKTEITTNNTEIVSRKIYEIVKSIRKQRKNNTDKLQDLVYSIFLKKNSTKQLLKNLDYISNYYSYRYPCIDSRINGPIYSRKLLEDMKEMGSFDSTSSTIISNIFENFISHVMDENSEIFDQSTYVESVTARGYGFNFRSVGLLPLKSSNVYNGIKTQSSNPEVISRSNNSALVDLLSEEKTDQYEYNFSLRSIDFSLVQRNSSNKACFVSRKIPINGHPLAIKAKLIKDRSNLDLNNYSYNLKESTSYEISFSNIEIPDQEQDWIPLVPSGETSVSSEVLFFDYQNKTSTTRFSFMENSLSIYENGIAVEPQRYSISGRTISMPKIDPKAIYVCSYDLNSNIYNYDSIDLTSSGLFQESTKPAYGPHGSGELYSSTDLTNRIKLSNIPYVNSSYLQNATYSNLVGTVFTGTAAGYSPVKVLLSDGSYAINITNYTSSSDYPDFSSKSSGTYFIQSGKEIIFNKYIDSELKVIYDYVPNSLRFRLIMRKNIPNIDYSASADAVIIKTKTKVYDPFYDKLTKVIYKK